ncbi:hypothetical protein [Sporolactobacillus terrae]|uniref:hypothetical protein n=1 Tax=Sporolactobacillus terrae TaxID=269673 RepID=UPI00048E8CC8|nr:hypothetical protein [Sporolactobacillus terrae]
MRAYQANTKSKELYKLMDELDECKEDMKYHAIHKKSKRLDYIEKNAKRIKQIAISMQKKIEEMRRK